MWATSDALKRSNTTSDNGQARSAGRRRHYGLAGLMDAAAAERRRVHIRGEGRWRHLFTRDTDCTGETALSPVHLLPREVSPAPSRRQSAGLERRATAPASSDRVPTQSAAPGTRPTRNA